MKVSIITVCFNSEKTIEDTLKSIQSQTYSDIEYIVIDGQSKDRTNDIVKKYSDIVSIHLSEKDNGLYDAMNKGLQAATGDIIGILNSDDFFFDDDVISTVVENIKYVDAVYADVAFYNPDNLNNIVRYYSSKTFSKSKLGMGLMPAHPSLYVKRARYQQVGFYNTKYKIAADFDIIVRLFNLPGFTSSYIPKVFVKMRLGGVSTAGFKSNILLNKEIMQSCRDAGIQTSWLKILSKYPRKLLGFIFKR